MFQPPDYEILREWYRLQTLANSKWPYMAWSSTHKHGLINSILLLLVMACDEAFLIILSYCDILLLALLFLQFMLMISLSLVIIIKVLWIWKPIWVLTFIWSLVNVVFSRDWGFGSKKVLSVSMNLLSCWKKTCMLGSKPIDNHIDSNICFDQH